MTMQQIGVLLIVVGPTLALLTWIVVEEIRDLREREALMRAIEAQSRRDLHAAAGLRVIEGGRR